MCGASVFERVEGVSVCGWLRHSLFELVDVALTAVLRVPQDGTFWVVDVFDPPSGSLVASAGVCLRDRPSSPKVPSSRVGTLWGVWWNSRGYEGSGMRARVMLRGTR